MEYLILKIPELLYRPYNTEHKKIKTLKTSWEVGGEKSQKKIQSVERLDVVEARGKPAARISGASRQALWWRHLANIMLQQSAQASCFPIGEHHVSRHQKIIIIGQIFTTGPRSIHCCEHRPGRLLKGKAEPGCPSHSMNFMSPYQSLADFAPC